ncbi:DsbA family protein [Patescibacteria group bacterium]|nr:DsbA family protein [Patescibacteria group bacterium]
MTKKIKYLKISTPSVIFFSLLLTISSFYSGISYYKNKTGTIQGEDTTQFVFSPEKSEKPELQFFVMSFCPYGNQIEDVIRPIADLLGDKADIKPQYIFNKIAQIDTYCKSSSGDPDQCASYVQSGYFKDESECQTVIADNLKSCLDTNNYIKTEDGSYYSSLHGRSEANQNIREICAWNQTDDKTKWWNFIDNVNKNCTYQNADTCWEEQAKQADFDTNKITDCFTNDAIAIIEKELEQTNKYNVSGSPTLLINGINFPPESAYAQDGKGSIKIDKKVISQDEYRTPNTIKEAICASFKKTPKECKEILENIDGSAPAAGGC